MVTKRAAHRPGHPSRAVRLLRADKTSEIAELRGLVRGLEQRATTQPAVGQVERLFDLVQRSQQGYRDLIDTFDDLLFSLSTRGKFSLPTAVLPISWAPSPNSLAAASTSLWIYARRNGRAAAEEPLPRFLERRHWSGVLRVCLNARLLHSLLPL